MRSHIRVLFVVKLVDPFDNPEKTVIGRDIREISPMILLALHASVECIRLNPTQKTTDSRQRDQTNMVETRKQKKQRIGSLAQRALAIAAKHGRPFFNGRREENSLAATSKTLYDACSETKKLNWPNLEIAAEYQSIFPFMGFSADSEWLFVIVDTQVVFDGLKHNIADDSDVQLDVWNKQKGKVGSVTFNPRNDVNDKLKKQGRQSESFGEMYCAHFSPGGRYLVMTYNDNANILYYELFVDNEKISFQLSPVKLIESPFLRGFPYGSPVVEHYPVKNCPWIAIVKYHTPMPPLGISVVDFQTMQVLDSMYLAVEDPDQEYPSTVFFSGRFMFAYYTGSGFEGPRDIFGGLYVWEYDGQTPIRDPCRDNQYSLSMPPWSGPTLRFCTSNQTIIAASVGREGTYVADGVVSVRRYQLECDRDSKTVFLREAGDSNTIQVKNGESGGHILWHPDNKHIVVNDSLNQLQILEDDGAKFSAPADDSSSRHVNTLVRKVNDFQRFREVSFGGTCFAPDGKTVATLIDFNQENYTFRNKMTRGSRVAILSSSSDAKRAKQKNEEGDRSL